MSGKKKEEIGLGLHMHRRSAPAQLGQRYLDSERCDNTDYEWDGTGEQGGSTEWLKRERAAERSGGRWRLRDRPFKTLA